jgi:hypothetical protein
MTSQADSSVEQTERFRAVLNYRQENLSIIPVGDDKRPLIQWKEFQTRLAREEELLEWWRAMPGANIGIVTGRISGITVIDCDSPDAIAWVEECLPSSYLGPIVGTPRGGRHYWFKYTEELRTGTAFRPGVDLRNDGGYVLAPPSMVPGGIYTWIYRGE